MTITIIEDDEKIRDELSILLRRAGYDVTLITDFNDVVKKTLSLNMDLILLDVNLPGQNGYDICKKLKRESNVPIIFVTSRNQSEDELLSITSGGMDFITKPYNKSILLEKIKRAINNNNPKTHKEITRKDCTLDLHLSILKYNGKQVELTRNEFLILYYFFTNERRIITKEELLEYLWNDKNYLDEGILMVNINRLRKKALELGCTNMIETVRKKGYIL